MESPTRSKRCSTCKQTLLETDFYREKNRPDGLQCLCKKCTYDSQKRYYARSQQGDLQVQRYCPDCKRTLPSTAFYKNRLGVGGLQTNCKECQRQRKSTWVADHMERSRGISRKHYWSGGGRENSLYRSRKAHTGITRQQYDSLMISQNGCCAICGKPPRKNSLYVDHCHSCGEIRSLLCVNCNKAIGCANEEITKVAMGILYITARALNIDDFPLYLYRKSDRKRINQQRSYFLTRQGGVCAICRTQAPPDGLEQRRLMHVDHCHSTHIVRGVLCELCNNTLGAFDDNIVAMFRAIDYLKLHSKHHHHPPPALTA